MRVVLDANVVVSGLFFGGAPQKILESIERKDITPCYILSTLAELERVLHDEKFARERTLLSFPISEFLEQLKSYAVISASPPGKFPTIIADDPADNELLASALACRAACIVSGDKHLLSLQTFCRIPILSPRRFLNSAGKVSAARGTNGPEHTRQRLNFIGDTERKPRLNLGFP